MCALAPAAGADVIGNPGTYHIDMKGTLTNLWLPDSPITHPHSFGDVTIDASGHISASQSAISFDEFDIPQPPLLVQAQPTGQGALTGSVNPDTGVMEIDGTTLTHLKVLNNGSNPPGVIADDCTVVTTFKLTSTNPGLPNGSHDPVDVDPYPGGQAYNPGTGKAQLLDNVFTIPKVVVTPTCPTIAVLGINSQLGLTQSPTGSVPGEVTLREDITITPPVKSPPPPAGAPDAKGDAANTANNTPVTIDVLKNDVPNPNAAIDDSSLAITSNPKHGSVVVNADHTVKYTPDAGFRGVDTFEYKICSELPTQETTTTLQQVNIKAAAAVAPCDTTGVSVSVAAPVVVVHFNGSTTVPSTAVAAAATQLPRTGSHSGALALLAAPLVLAGAALAAFARRRTRVA